MLTTYRQTYIKHSIKKQENLKEREKLTNSLQLHSNSAPVCECCKKPLKNDEIQLKNSEEPLKYSANNPSGNKNTDEIQLASTACANDSQNHYLKQLRICYPDLYERLGKLPEHELVRRLEVDRFRTSYKREFCVLPQYPEGVYKSMEQQEDQMKNKCMNDLPDNCVQFNCDAERIQHIKAIVNQPKPYYISPVSYPIKKSDFKMKGSAETGSIKDPNISEYRDVISRTGCIIIANRIHNKCKTIKADDGCRHILKKTCRTYK